MIDRRKTNEYRIWVQNTRTARDIADGIVAFLAIAFVAWLLVEMFLNAAVAQTVPCGGACGDQTNYQQTHVNIDQSREVVNNSTRTTDNSVTATGGNATNTAQGGAGGAGGQSSAQGGSVGAVSAEDNSQTNVSSDTDNSSSFLSLSLSLVQASGCWGGVNAGGGEDNTAGFLGFSWLNNDCWMDHLAAMTQDAEHNAELKCHSKKFRNAIGWDVKRRDRRKHCIAEVTASNLELIALQRAQMEQAVTVIERDCSATEESLARCNAAFKEALSK